MPKMQAKARELGIADHVRFLGVRSDVADLMQAMDVFAFPSLYEGLPVTMVEAQAAGLPCIISDKVPPECILTEGLVDVMPLSAGTEAWADAILGKCNTPVLTAALKLPPTASTSPRRLSNYRSSTWRHINEFFTKSGHAAEP